MFIQVLHAEALDPDGLRREFERWHEELAPGAPGWLGTTGGVTDRGVFIGVARFASAADAAANGARPEQGAWWDQCSKLLGDPEFGDYPEVEVLLAGESEEAGFVQVFTGLLSDAARFRAMAVDLAHRFEEYRPEETGDTIGVRPDGRFAFTGYYTSEEEARAGESKEIPAPLQAAWDEWIALASDLTYFDISDPWIRVRR